MNIAETWKLGAFKSSWVGVAMKSRMSTEGWMYVVDFLRMSMTSLVCIKERGERSS